MLNVRSCYSIAHSVIKIDELVNTVKTYGLSYVSICDDNFFALPELLKQAKKNDLTALFGYNYKTEDGTYSFFILSKNGYESLIRFSNGLGSLDETIKEEGLCCIFTGALTLYQELSEKYQDVYYAVSTIDEAEINIKRPVLFTAVNTLEPEDSEALSFIQDIGKLDATQRESPACFSRIYPYLSENDTGLAVENIERIVEQVKPFDLKVNYSIPLPQCTLKKDENELLYEKCLKELKAKGLDSDEVYLKRFEYEYSIIKELNFSRYLLLGADIVETAKNIDAWIGPGRGSAVSSLLVYLLGITRPDPLANGLIFERFLSLDRDDEPDIDIDVEDEKRQELLNVLREKYTKEKMVNIITFGTYGEKLVKREIVKRYELDPKIINWKDYEALMSKLIGLPHHISTHAAGIIFSEGDLRELIPLREASQDSFITQFDMNALKECGLFKMDILGLITLSTLKKMYQFPENIDLDDEQVYCSVKSDNLCGIFQLDSKSGRSLTERLTPKDFNEIRMIISLNRPGPSQSGMTQELISRRNGDKKVAYFHPLVKEILSSTWGVPIYQEQIMEMSMKLGGFAPKQANELRKAMAKKDQEKMNRLKTAFVNGSVEKGLDENGAEELFNTMAEFAGYAFNKAHATAYGYITYWTAYLKFRKPLSFYKVLINASHGKHVKLYQIINEARKNGIKVLSPDINRSSYETVVEDEGLRLGFAMIKDLNKMIVEKIINERVKDEYKSVEDFVLRNDKNLLSDFLLKRLLEAHLFSQLNEKITLEGLVKIREKNSKILENIGAKLFGGISVKEIDNVEKSTNNKTIQANDFLEEEFRSFGFLVDYRRVFGIDFSPFFSSDMETGIITSELKQNRYEIHTGIDNFILNPQMKLKKGDTILFKKNRKACSFMGRINPGDNPGHSELFINQNYLFELDKLLESERSYMKKAGIKKIVIDTKKYKLEVFL